MLIAYLLSFMVSVMQALHTPLISVYALEIGIEAYQIGLLSGLGALIYSLIAPFSQFFSSRIGEAKSIAASLALLALSYFILNFAKNLGSIAVVVSLSLFAYAVFWPALEALISHEGATAASFSTAWSSGSLAGSLIISPCLIAPKKEVFTAISLSFIALVALSLRQDNKKLASKVPEIKDLFEGIRNLPHAWAWVFSYAAIQGAIYTFYPIIVEVEGLPVWYVSLAFFSIMGMRTLVFLFKKKLSKYLGSPYAIGFFLLSGVFLPFTNDAIGVMTLSILVGIALGVLYEESLSRAFSSSSEKRGIYTGLFESFIGFGYTLGPIIAGAASTISLSMAIPVGSLFSFIIVYSPIILSKNLKS